MQATPPDFTYPYETSLLARGAMMLEIFPGIYLEMLNIYPEKDLTITKQLLEDPTQEEYKLTFSLDGEAETKNFTEDQSVSFNVAPGTFTLFPLRCGHGSLSLRKKVQANMLSIRIKTQQLKSFIGVDDNINMDTLMYPPQSIALSVSQKSILYQMFNSTKSGIAHSLYLQSKAIELLSEFIESVSMQMHGNCCINCEHYMSKEEICAIRSAKGILENNMMSPPCLDELSRIVGLNTSKLKRGFRAVYNTTPYASLHKARMVKAGNLLSQKGMNVSQVAWTVGYSNLSHFAAAFLKHYGVNPKVFQMSKGKERLSSLGIQGRNATLLASPENA